MEGRQPDDESTGRISTTPTHARRAIRIRRRRRMPRAAWYTLGFFLLVIVVVVTQFAVHTYRTDPRDARAILEREMRVNTIQPRERVRAVVSVFQRQAIDYFRATRGLLVLTDRRLLFLGLLPRDLLASGEGPPTFVQRDFPLDTLVRLSSGRTFFQIAKAIGVATPQGRSAFGVPSSAWPQAEALMDSLGVDHARLLRDGKRQAMLRRRRATERRSAAVAMQRPFRYVVKRGDALASIASQWNTTVDRLREWNGMADNMIRVGQGLIVRR